VYLVIEMFQIFVYFTKHLEFTFAIIDFNLEVFALMNMVCRMAKDVFNNLGSAFQLPVHISLLPTYSLHKQHLFNLEL
jgi:hypothetical protein